MKGVATLREHLRGCEAAQRSLQSSDGGTPDGVSSEALLEAGYLPAGPASAGTRERAAAGNDGVDELTQGSRRLKWGRRAGIGGSDQAIVGEAERVHAGGSHKRWSMGPPTLADAMEGLDEAGAAAAVIPRDDDAQRAEDAELDRAQQLALLRKRAQAEVMRREHWCSVCGKAFSLTPTEILQHRRSHCT